MVAAAEPRRCARLPFLLSLVNASTVTGTGLSYALNDSFVSPDFFSRWSFWVDPDPTHGFVEYVNQSVAADTGLIRASDEHVYIGVDTFSWLNASSPNETGRRSVRIQSLATYNSGLFVIDLEHVPTGCGTWPAFWMYGEDPTHTWPEWGEYDIIEGVHERTQVMTTLHTTGARCNQLHLKSGENFSGTWDMAPSGDVASECDIDAKGQWHNQGCGQFGPDASLGTQFNDRGGGTFAAEWDTEAQHIRTWFWPAGSEPPDLARQKPDPETWGKPYSYFSLSPRTCAAEHFVNMRLVFDVTFCGDLANPTFSKSCPKHANDLTCREFVASHPEAFSEAYWSIRSLNVYQLQNSSSTVPNGSISTKNRTTTAADTATSASDVQNKVAPAGTVANRTTNTRTNTTRITSYARINITTMSSTTFSTASSTSRSAGYSTNPSGSSSSSSSRREASTKVATSESTVAADDLSSTADSSGIRAVSTTGPCSSSACMGIVGTANDGANSSPKATDGRGANSLVGGSSSGESSSSAVSATNDAVRGAAGTSSTDVPSSSLQPVFQLLTLPPPPTLPPLPTVAAVPLWHSPPPWLPRLSSRSKPSDPGYVMVKSASGKPLPVHGDSHSSMLQALNWRAACLLALGVLTATVVSVSAIVLRGMRCTSRRLLDRPRRVDPREGAAVLHEEEGLINMGVHACAQPQQEAQCPSSRRTAGLLQCANRSRSFSLR